MSRSGLFTQLGVSAEVTYGTLVAPARFLEFTEESLKLEIERLEAEGLRTGARVLRSTHWADGRKMVSGDLELEVANKGFGLLFRMMLGAAATAADGAGFKHTFTIGDLFGDMMTLQVGRPDTGGTVRPFSYLGCKVAEWELTQEENDWLKLALSIDGRDEDSATGLTAATAPALTELFHGGMLTLTVAGGAFSPTKFSVKGDNGLDTERFKLKSSILKDEPIEAAKREITGELEGEFESLTAYNRFTAGTVVGIVATWTAVSTYDTAKPFKLVLTLPAVRFDGETPEVGGPEVIEQALPFKVLDNGTDQPITLELYTSDATP